MKYITLVYYSIVEVMAYRVSFFLWRFRSLLNLLLVYYLWTAVYSTNSNVFGYSEVQMLTYVLLSSIIATVVLTTRTGNIAGEIVQGTIVSYLLRPMPFFRWLMTKELADKLLNLGMVILEVLILVALTKPTLYVQTQPAAYVGLAIGVVEGVVIGFFLSLVVSFVAFWSAEIWAPRFIFSALILFFAGSYFPLDILPRPLYILMMATPFPYLYYLPTRIYINGFDASMALALCIGALWVVLLYMAARAVWRKGMREFSFYGA